MRSPLFEAAGDASTAQFITVSTCSKMKATFSSFAMAPNVSCSPTSLAGQSNLVATDDGEDMLLPGSTASRIQLLQTDTHHSHFLQDVCGFVDIALCLFNLRQPFCEPGPLNFHVNLRHVSIWSIRDNMCEKDARTARRHASACAGTRLQEPCKSPARALCRATGPGQISPCPR